MSAPRLSKWIVLGLTVVMIATGLSVAGVVNALPSAAPGPTATPAAPVAPELSSSAPATSSGIAPPATPATAQPGGLVEPTRGAQVVADLAQRGVSARDVYLPDFAGAGRSVGSSGHVNLSYGAGPAPYGIGDFGLRNVSGTITPYVTQTTSLNASFSADKLLGYSPDLSGPDEYGVQLNAVLYNVTLFGETGYQFWTQNVFEFTPSNDSLQFVSNIWNFSAPDAALTCNVFYAAGGNNECPEFYYGLSAPIPASYPYEVRMWMNSTLNQGRNEVFFNYTVSSALGNYAGSYDYAIFNSTVSGGPAAPLAQYQANGYQYNNLGLPSDFEITLGGPGGGSNFDVFDGYSDYMTLTYLNASGEYQNVDSAYNVGGETGETSVGVTAQWARYGGCANCVSLSAGPSFLYGLWNVSGATPLGAFSSNPWFIFNTDPSTAFLFFAPGIGVTDLSQFEWAPNNLIQNTPGIELPLGNYTIWFLAANYDPFEITLEFSASCFPCTADVGLGSDPTVGVYTPLWAFNETAASEISSGIDGYGNYLLFSNQLEPLGITPPFSDAGYYDFPWFGAFNDYMFPVFAGIYLNDVYDVDMSPAPSLFVNFPSDTESQLAVSYFGTPDWNNLQIFIYGSTNVNFFGGTIGGWWPSAAYFGPSQSIGQVTYWNTSLSGVVGVTFETGGEALFFYGGYSNDVQSSEFFTSVPDSPNPYSTVAGAYGAIGLVDTDWGDAYEYGAAAYTECDICDLIYNNLFDTEITATSLYYDPYTGYYPNQYPYTFSQAYNIAPECGVTNIIGGSCIGGNYWWDYGLYWNPYGVLPYAALNPLPVDEEFTDIYGFICESYIYYCDYGGGDYYPLTYTPIYTVTFEETGLPAATGWEVSVYVDGSDSLLGDLESGYLYNVTNTSGTDNYVTFGFPAVTNERYWAFSYNSSFAAYSATFNVTNANITIVIAFQPAVTWTVHQSGLPGGTNWAVDVFNSVDEYWDAYSNSSSLTVTGLLPGDYTFEFSNDAGYFALPSSGDLTLTGNASFSVEFVPVYTLTVSETGLPNGTTWYFSYANASGSINDLLITGDASVTLDNVPALTYVWSASASGYAATPANGQVTVSGDASVSVAFASITATGTISGTITPSSGTLYIDGAPASVGSGGAFSATVPVGVHSIEVTASGYAPYFNNVTVTAGGSTHLTIALTANSSTASTGVGSLGWLLIGVLAVVAAILLVTTLLFARRGRQPPAMSPYTPPAGAAAGGAAPPPPAWQEPPPPPPSS